MSYGTHSGRYARTMSQINPYMSGPVEPMPDARSGTIRGVALAAAIGVALAMLLASWAMA